MAFIFIVIIITVAAFVSTDWLTHITMTKSHTDTYGYGSYTQFVKQFDKYAWSHESFGNGESLWNREYSCEFHANIIKFESKGMILKSPFALYRAKRYVKRYCKETLGLIRYIKWE
ncbi:MULTISPECIES: hypothetical protein [unclassified Paenibacillus]|uniref:hypothetical protein n=1 Tax=unclassified Paenibacillus TaxID=185978 RepID=UPI00020D6BB6|nr:MULTISPECIES: hypothetical protein [unclassified Paenibacillus]EGL17730.1 hypothetical protein HMPREF9413_4492 [Paenibacillus sp. HGF7]EPD81355.1 hypothetical protein HMPREF1207_05113 [Paenibacillus sp. HGH0039]